MVRDSDRKTQERKGFTLVELLVGMGLFSVVVSIAAGGFVSALRTQRQATDLVLANSNLSLTIEQMAREIRTASNFICSDGTGGPSGTVITCSSGVTFLNAHGDTVTYCLDADGAIDRSATPSGVNTLCGSAGFQKITAKNVNVRDLTFRLFGNQDSDTFPPRITISLGVSARAAGVSENIVHLETSVSSRALDT